MTSMFSQTVCMFAVAFTMVCVGKEPLEQPGSASPLKAEFERDSAAIAEERKASLAPLRREYADALDALAVKLRSEGRAPLAAAARVEKARVDAGSEIMEESISSAPFEVLAARGAFLEKQRALHRDFETRISQRAERYLSALKEAAAVAESEHAEAARMLFEAERARLTKAGQIAPRVLKHTRAAGGNGGGRFEEVGVEDALLTGLVLHTGDFAGHHVLVAVQPIFRTSKLTRFGVGRGNPRGKAVTIDAKDGYAIGGLNLSAGDRVDGLEVVFMKIKADRLALDPSDSYKSEWVGGRGGGLAQIPASGNRIVGIYGATGVELDSLGLIEGPSVAAIASKTPVATLREVTRENPATVEIAGLTAEPLVESPTRGSGKWQRVPQPCRGAKIFSVTPNPHLGVAEYKVSVPGRVYLACNFEYQGNRDGGWAEERWMPEDFLKNGWARVEGTELQSWEGRTFVIFTRELKAGETGRLRCNKYEPPYFISFNP